MKALSQDTEGKVGAVHPSSSSVGLETAVIITSELIFNQAQVDFIKWTL